LWDEKKQALFGEKGLEKPKKVEKCCGVSTNYGHCLKGPFQDDTFDYVQQYLR
jgi:hypothetical protein